MEVTIERFDVGPILGAVSPDSARLWGRGRPTGKGAPRRMFGAARFRKKGENRYSPAQHFKLNPNFDLTGVTVLHPLKADTDYEYEIGAFAADVEFEHLADSDGQRPRIEWKNAHEGSFRTASKDQKAQRSFVFGSCRYLLRLFGGSWFDNRGDKTFRSILKQIEEKGRRVDQILMLGDQIYADDLNFLHADQGVDEYFKRYRDVFSQDHFARLVSKTPTYMTLDDHEIEDNWPARKSRQDFMRKFPAAMHAYLTYQLSHSPLFSHDENGRLREQPNHYWYQFDDGCCEFFVMDMRTERNYGEDGDERIQVISDVQMKALKDWLADGSKRVKLIATSIPFFPDLDGGTDRWDAFPDQRNEILDHIRDNKIRRVVFLSGDVHSSMTAELSHPSDPKFKIVSVVSSPFYWPYPHSSEKGFQTTGTLAGSSGYRLKRGGPVHSTDNFARVTVSPTQLRAEFFKRKGATLGTAKTHKF